MKTISALFIAICALSLIGCEKKATVIVSIPPEPPITSIGELQSSKLGTEVDQYVATPTAEQASRVEIAVAELNVEIAGLKNRVATSTEDNRAEAQAREDRLTTYRDQQMTRFTTAKVANATGKTLDKVGQGLQNAAEKVGDAVKDGTRKVGDKVEETGDKMQNNNH